jgi:DNA-binding SARP family transcriptional activator/Flp pilus assembly protein TadD
MEGTRVADGMEFCLLGPLVVRCDGKPVPVTAGRQRAVLATLLLNAGHAVGLDELAEALWGAEPPRSARVSVQNYVMRLRNALGEAGRERIGTLPDGYVIRIAAGELDLSRFEDLLTAARTAASQQEWENSAARVEEALSLWRGEPLGGTGSEVLTLRQVPRLTELRLAAIETRVDALLHLGQQARVIGELRQLTAEHPLRERLHGLLMLALYREGRQGEALAAYHQARRVLVEELGAEPGAELNTLHRRILAADPALAAHPMPPAAPAGGELMTPRQLPAAVRHFTGRGDELVTLTRLLNQAHDDQPGTVVISAIGGTAGVGKTALAVHWAHRVADRFPDGQLYVNLRGYDPGQPMPAADALASFLRALGVPGQEIPSELDERAARYRSLLARRRVLVVLDNASSEEQVRPLIPATPACMTLVTGRDALAGLIARDGAARIDLDLLPMDDAVELLQTLIGERASTERTATEALADRCCRLPLALRVAAELAAARPGSRLADLAAELTDQQQRLDLLDAGGDPKTAIRAVFSWSYRHLPSGTARAFRLAGMNPAPDMDSYSVAALAGVSLAEGKRLLDRLARAYLVHPAGSCRYGLHDLLRGYARELAELHDLDDAHAALTRLFGYHLQTAATAMDILFPAERSRRPQGKPTTTLAPPITEPAAAGSWLDSHRANLLAAAAYAAEHGWAAHATQLAATLFRYLDFGGHYPEAITLHSYASRAARQTGDLAAEAEALNSLGATHWRQGHYPQALTHLEQALALCRQAGDQAGEARALGNLGLIETQQGRYPQAALHQRQVLDLYRKRGDVAGQAHALGSLGELNARQGNYARASVQLQRALRLIRDAGNQFIEPYVLINLGDVAMRQGRYAEATDHQQEALALFRRTGDRPGEACALTNLGDIELRQDHYQRAARYLRQGLAAFQETGDRSNEAYALASLGDVCLRQDRSRQALRHQQQALTLFRETGDRSGETQALNGFGEALLATGQPDLARTQHTAALTLARELSDRHQQARALSGLGYTSQACGDPSQARRHWRRALTLYTRLGAPEAAAIQAGLNGIGVVT